MFDRKSFGLSLNRKDCFDYETNPQCSLSELGLTNGDIVYVMQSGNSGFSFLPSSSVASNVTQQQSTQPKQLPRPNQQPSFSQPTIEDIKTSLTKNLVENKSENELESLVVLIHTLLIKQNFREVKTKGSFLQLFSLEFV